MLSIPFGAVQRLIAIAFRPSLHIQHRGVRVSEKVSVQYSALPYSSLESPSYTGTFVRQGEPNPRIGTAYYIRAWVHSSSGFPAQRCQVFVDSIKHNGKTLESERSPLHWTDVDKAYEFPIITRGERNGRYIDICSADSIDPRLQIISEKGLKGYHRFDEPGDYTIELSAEAMKPCKFGKLRLTVFNDGKNWKNIKVLSAI